MKYGAEIPALSATDIERFWQSVEKAECWVWTGQTRRGYGRFVIHGKAYAAHRVSWVIEHGTEPASEVLDHTCGNPPCVNPAHLDDVSQSVSELAPWGKWLRLTRTLSSRAARHHRPDERKGRLRWTAVSCVPERCKASLRRQEARRRSVPCG